MRARTAAEACTMGRLLTTIRCGSLCGRMRSRRVVRCRRIRVKCSGNGVTMERRRCPIPSVSNQQRKFFGAVLGGAADKPKGMTMGQVRDFAATPSAGLPKYAPSHHLADGGMFVQREGVSPGGAHWMELVRSGTVPGKVMPSERAPLQHMADGKKPDGHWM